MPIDILVADFVDFSTRVETAVRRAVEEIGPTNIRLALLPSDRHGRWDLGLKDAQGWSLRSFDSPIEELPARAASEVRDLLRS